MKYFSLLLALLCSAALLAQTSEEAFRYSFFDVLGTARSVGVGGTMGAIGGDFTTTSINPAGLAWYRRSELIVTPTLFRTQTESELVGGQGALEEGFNRFGLGGVGIVIANQPRGGKMTTANFAFGMNRVADLNRRFSYEGTTPGSITTRFLELAEGFFEDELPQVSPQEAELAFASGAIFPIGDTSYGSDFGFVEPVLKAQTVETTGSINELVFSLAGNFDEKLLFGATVGVPFFSAEIERRYTERDPEDANAVFTALDFTENVTTTGIGVNAKLGLIYRPIHEVRVGLAMHTPTAFSLEDNFSNSLFYEYVDATGATQRGDATAPTGIQDYNLRTPWRFLFNAGAIVGKKGFVGLEVNYADYGGAEYRFDNPNDAVFAQELSDSISLRYQGSLGVKLGGEYALDQLRLRAGVNFFTSPDAIDEESQVALSGGLGYYWPNVFLDLGYQITERASLFRPYLTVDPPRPLVNNLTTRQRLLLTLGFKFK